MIIIKKILLIINFLTIVLFFNIRVYAIDVQYDEYTQALIEKLILLPDNILQDFYSKNWGIVLTDEDLNEKFFNGIYGKVLGLTDKNNKIIYLYKDIDYISNCTIHEIGHFIACTYNRPDKTDLFYQIYRQEKYNFNSLEGDTNYAIGSSSEYFAEAFQEIILHPNEMQQQIPLTYGYIWAIINNIYANCITFN